MTSILNFVTRESKTIIHTEYDKYNLDEPSCDESRRLADSRNREFIYNNFQTKLLVIGAPAGSGKTTTIRKCIQTIPSKKCLYIVFNSSMKDEFISICKRYKITNVDVHTFDSLCLYFTKTKIQHTINPNDYVNLSSKNIHKIVPDFKDINRVNRSKLLSIIGEFCKTVKYTSISQMIIDYYENETYTKSICGMENNKLADFMENTWKCIINSSSRTHEITRKEAFIYGVYNYINDHYAQLFGDESQDIDPFMAELLFNYITTNRMLVGDHLQRIYAFRNCINALSLSSDNETYNVKGIIYTQLYVTYRFGKNLVDHLNETVSSCSMVSGCSHDTEILQYPSPKKKPTHICKYWRTILTVASITENCYIYGWTKKKTQLVGRINSLLLQQAHNQTTHTENVTDEHDENAGLSEYLLSKSPCELKELINTIDNNRAKRKDKASLYLATVHQTKGLEFDHIIVDCDITTPYKQCKNDLYYILYYTAVTRCINSVYIMTNSQ